MSTITKNTLPMGPNFFRYLLASVTLISVFTYLIAKPTPAIGQDKTAAAADQIAAMEKVADLALIPPS